MEAIGHLPADPGQDVRLHHQQEAQRVEDLRGHMERPSGGNICNIITLGQIQDFQWFLIKYYFADHFNSKVLFLAAYIWSEVVDHHGIKTAAATTIPPHSDTEPQFEMLLIFYDSNITLSEKRSHTVQTFLVKCPPLHVCFIIQFILNSHKHWKYSPKSTFTLWNLSKKRFKQVRCLEDSMEYFKLTSSHWNIWNAVFRVQTVYLYIYTDQHTYKTCNADCSVLNQGV